MRRTKFLTIILFLAAVACYVGYHFLLAAGTDSTRPVITMDSPSITLSVSDDKSAVLQGVTAKDNRDGDVTSSLMVESESNFITDTTREVTIAAVDQAGNVAKTTREVVYSDYTPTEFSLSAPLRFEVGTTNLTVNFTATDVLDGDITNRMKLTKAYDLSNSAGDYPMEFAVTNSAGAVTKLTATVTLYSASDYNKLPEIELSNYLIYVKQGAIVNPESYLTAIEYKGHTYTKTGSTFVPDSTYQNLESIPLSDITIESSGDTSAAGSYEITYSYITTDNELGTVRLIVIVQ